MTGVLMRRDSETDTQRRQPCEDRGRDWGYAVTCQGKSRCVGHHEKLDKTRKDYSLESLEGK